MQTQDPDEIADDGHGPWRRRLEVLGVIAGVIGAIAAVIALKPVVLPDHGAADDRPTRSATFAFTDPEPDTVVKTKCSFEARGQGTPPPGKSIAVATQELNERYYFESTVHIEQGRWTVPIQVGTSGTRKGTRFQLSAVLMDATWERYLGGVTDEQGATYWSSEALPPGAKVVAAATIETSEHCKD
ncbi:hypothetical protein [Actinomadura sp. NPDC048394]|uniref:hypothetical protein n=1 Tax=Actinomadura sp. NPDC048394 TaxID=3158223 RepID=UPI0033D767D8